MAVTAATVVVVPSMRIGGVQTSPPDALDCPALGARANHAPENGEARGCIINQQSGVRFVHQTAKLYDPTSDQIPGRLRMANCGIRSSLGGPEDPCENAGIP